MDQGDRAGNYLEATASSMFVYALAKGINRGYLPRENYLPVVLKGYEGLIRDLIKSNPDGSVSLTHCCEVAGLGYTNARGRARDGSFDYYVSEPVCDNDLKGVGPFILAGIEVQQLISNDSPPLIVRSWADYDKVLSRIQAPTFPAHDFPITDFGAKPGADVSGAIAAAIAACHEAGGGRVVVPAGEWHTGAIRLLSNVNLHVAEGATLRWIFDLAKYPIVFTRWEGVECMNYSACIYAFEQENIAVTGTGTLDGGADLSKWWGWNDKSGTKLGLALSLIAWSAFSILNAFVGRTALVHVFVRSLFGIGEAGNFPASIKTVAEWFPKRERALATGIFNSGSNLGAMVSALFVLWCMIHFGDQEGWKMAYILTGTAGFLWLIFWFWLYASPSQHKRISKSEYDYIHVDDDAIEPTPAANGTKVSWFKLLSYRQTWAFVFGKFMTDGVWWFYLFWLPDYLRKQFAMDKHQVMLPTFIVYGVAIIGSIYGGSIPMTFIKKGMPVYKARMTAMLIIAIFPLTVLSTQYFGNIDRFGSMAAGLAVAAICIGCAAHQAWSANLFTTVSDMFPKKAVGSVTGIGAAAGGLGGYIVQKLAGGLTDAFAETPQTAYLLMFIICALSYIIAWGLMKAFVPQHRPITDL